MGCIESAMGGQTMHGLDRCGSVMLDLATRAMLRASLAPPPQARQRGRRIFHFQKNQAERDPNMLILHDCLGRMSHQAKNMSNGRWGGPLVSRVP